MPSLTKSYDSLSYSKLRDLDECPYRWKLVHVDHVKPTFEIARFISADVVDESLTEWVRSGFPKNELLKIAERRWAQWKQRHGKYIRWKGPFDERDKLLETRRAAFNLELAMRKLDLCRPAVKIQIDLEGWDSSGSLKLTGRTDVVDTERKELWDLKTTTNPRWLDPKQLHYYHLIWIAQHKERLRKLGWLTPLMDEPIQVVETEGNSELIDLIEVIKKNVNFIRAGDFPPLGIEKKACYMCMVNFACVHYRKEQAKKNPNVVTVNPSGSRKVKL